MAELEYEIIPVTLGDNRTVAMSIRSDRRADKTTVIFADPRKLWPLAAAIDARMPSHTSKDNAASEGLEKAIYDPANMDLIYFDPNHISLPMASVNYSQATPENLVFSDGLTRTMLLLNKGAHFVPLQVYNQNAQLLHELVGGTRQPEPAATFVTPYPVRDQRQDRFYQHLKALDRV